MGINYFSKCFCFTVIFYFDVDELGGSRVDNQFNNVCIVVNIGQ